MPLWGNARPTRCGSVLLLVLVVVAMLTLGTATYLEVMQTEHRAVRHRGRGAQAEQLAASGVEYVKPYLAMTPQELLAQGGMTNNPAVFQAVLVDDQPDEADRGRVTIMAPAQVSGYYSGVQYGLENESAKLNVNTLLAEGAEDQAAARLLALPGMTVDTADAILDWIDKDDQPRANGAEADYYAGLDPGYTPRNAPLADVDELLLVRGVTPELLYGLDQNRNNFIEANEQPRGLAAELDNSLGQINRGWAGYLTVHSVEAGGGAGGAKLIDLNSQDLQTLYKDLQTALTDEQAKFIILYRQYGGQPTNGTQTNGAANSAGGATGASSSGGNQSSSGNSGTPVAGTPGTSAASGGNASTPQKVPAASINLKFDQQGGNQISSPLALVGVTVQVPGEGDNAPAQQVESPWRDDPNSYRDLLKVYDAAAISSARRIAGRVNVNAASRPVLGSIPQLSPAAIDQIVGRREPEPDPVLSDQRHAIWLLIENLVTLEEMRALERYITTRGDAFSGQAVGYFDAGPLAARGEFVLDRTGTTPRLRAWRDLTPLGRGYTAEVLGVPEAPGR
jgi:hypothetical protein